jgi:hypothetical protein
MNHYPTTDIAMACFLTNEERPARVYGFDFMMDNLKIKTPGCPRVQVGLIITQLRDNH